MSGVNVQMLFSPQSCSLEILESTLTENRKELSDLILSQVEESVAKGGSHNNLIIGPRGTGKTHLLHYIRKILTERIYKGNDAFHVISLSEEERGITTFFYFLLSCLRASGIPNEKLITRLSSLERVQSTVEAQDFFKEITHEKPTLLILENFSTNWYIMDSPS